MKSSIANQLMLQLKVFVPVTVTPSFTIREIPKSQSIGSSSELISIFAYITHQHRFTNRKLYSLLLGLNGQFRSREGTSVRVLFPLPWPENQ